MDTVSLAYLKKKTPSVTVPTGNLGVISKYAAQLHQLQNTQASLCLQKELLANPLTAYF